MLSGLTKLDLYHNKLTGPIPEAIGKITEPGACAKQQLYVWLVGWRPDQHSFLSSSKKMSAKS